MMLCFSEYCYFDKGSHIYNIDCYIQTRAEGGKWEGTINRRRIRSELSFSGFLEQMKKCELNRNGKDREEKKNLIKWIEIKWDKQLNYGKKGEMMLLGFKMDVIEKYID